LHKQTIAAEEANRDAIASQVEQHNKVMQKAYADHIAGNITEAKRNQIINDEKIKHQEAQKKLDDAEIAVGKLKNKGDAEQFELMKRRLREKKRLLISTNRWDAAQQAALEKMEKEMKKSLL